MSSPSRESFLTAHSAFRLAVNEPNVLQPTDLGSLLRRGLTVIGFNLLEAFLEARVSEIAAYVNGGVVQFTDLPDRLQAEAIRGSIEAGRSRLRRAKYDLPGLRLFSKDLGSSLTAIDHHLNLSPLMWLWSGSNMSPEDYKRLLRLFHVPTPFETATSLINRLGLGPTDLNVALADITRERHRCAHDASHNVTALWLRTMPERVLGLAVAGDMLVSVAATQLRLGSTAFFNDADWTHHREIKLRFVVERSVGAAEFKEGAARATRVLNDVSAVLAHAAAACAPQEVVVRKSRLGTLVGWAVPAVD